MKKEPLKDKAEYSTWLSSSPESREDDFKVFKEDDVKSAVIYLRTELLNRIATNKEETTIIVKIVEEAFPDLFKEDK